jgi:hypothetical protein
MNEQEKQLLVLTKQVYKKEDNFNVFNLFGIGTNEVKTHTPFIAALLNPKGSHNQGSVFLALFLNMLATKDNAKDLNTNAADCEVFREYSMGVINEDSTTGGRIDILIWDCQTKQKITIENKIYAPEQPNQLLRYQNFDKQAILYYLTRFGEDSSEKNVTYTRLSYCKNILDWLADCQKVPNLSPNVYHLIVQYEHLVRQLTNQNLTHIMEEQELLIKLASSPENLQAFFNLNSIVEVIYNKLLADFNKQLQELATRKGLILTYNIDRAKIHKGVKFFFEKPIKDYGYHIFFDFAAPLTQNLWFGLGGKKSTLPALTNIEQAITANFKDAFGKAKTSDLAICYVEAHSSIYSSIANWTDDVYVKISTGELIKDIEQIVDKILACLPEAKI